MYVCMYVCMHVVCMYVGRWTKEEESSLLKAFEHYGIDWKKEDCCLPDNVTWDLISKEVGTRSGVQCRRKW